jgi:peptide/nickel transport system permease protein
VSLPTDPAASAEASTIIDQPVVEPRPGGGYGGYARRLVLTALGSLAFILVMNFFLFRILPGDPAAKYKGARNVSQDAIKELQESFDQPLYQQFFDYLRDPLGLDGISFTYSKPVWDVIMDALPKTLVLMTAATVISVTIGVFIGIKAGWKRGSRFDKNSTGVSLTLWGAPEFWLGMMLIIVFASGFGPIPDMFPPGGFSSTNTEGWGFFRQAVDIAWHMVLPVTALAAVYIAEYSLIVRSSIIDESQQDYLTTGRAYGLRDKQVRQRHAVPNASLPTITLILLNIGFIVGGAVTIEYVFSLPGLGSLTVQAVQAPDLPLLQALFLLFTVSVLVAVTVADLVIAWVDPRIRR